MKSTDNLGDSHFLDNEDELKFEYHVLLLVRNNKGSLFLFLTPRLAMWARAIFKVLLIIF